MPLNRPLPRGCYFAHVAAPLLACALAVHIGAQNPFPPASGGAESTSEQAVDQRSAGPRSGRRERLPAGGAKARATKRGLIVNTDAASAGYTLFAPLNSTTTYLVDLQGQLVHSWLSKYVPGQAAYLLDDGSILRCAREPGNRHFAGGGIGGRVERIAPDGTLVWKFVYADENHCQHHDIEPLPNGHVLLIAWEKKTRDQVVAAGGDPEQMTGGEMWPDCVIEVEPQGASGGKIVWEWHVWDHLVQEFDPSKPRYGAVADHPELVDLNYHQRMPRVTPAEIKRLRSLGYVGGGDSEETGEGDEKRPPFAPGPGGVDMRADWCHTNAIAYNAKLDQIALSVHNFNEIWIIDHSTSTQEAAGHRGGRQKRGGDLLYRWGNPRAYGAGGVKEQTLFGQHDVRWIPESFPGAGHLILFNNGVGRPNGRYSSIVQFAPPVDSTGSYRLGRGQAFGPSKPSWEYTAANKQDLFSHSISGAERLPNGNTLVCSGEQGRILEVTAGGKTVWEYINPYIERSRPNDGFGPPGRGSGVRRPAQEGRDTPPVGGRGGGESDGRRRGATRSGGTNGRPERRPPWGPAGRGPLRPPPGAGPRGGGPGPGPAGPPGGLGGGLFRATRLPPDHPGVQRLLRIKAAGQDGAK